MIARSWVIAGAAALAMGVAGVYGWGWWARHREQVATGQAGQHNTAATSAAAQGGVHDQAAAAQAQTVREAQARAEAANAEVARLRAALARVRPGGVGAPVPPAVPGVPGDQPAGAPADLAPVVAAQAELIQAQDARHEADQQVIGALQVQVVDLTAARDAWRMAAQEREQEATAQRIAQEAALSAAKAERWKGRLEGLAVGFGSVYLAGRLK
jgi:predicted negative regulator of RcsB-dependent stress response